MSDAPLISRQMAGTCILLTATLVAGELTSHRRPESLAQPLDTISPRIAGFEARDNPPLAEDILRELRPTSYLSRRYSKGDLEADLLISFYAFQRAGQSMHSPKHCLPGAGWEISDHRTMEIPVPGGTARVNRDLIEREGTRMVALYWYQSKDRIIASEYSGKVLLARDALLRNSTAASIVRIIVPDRASAPEEASALAAEVITQLWQCFRQTTKNRKASSRNTLLLIPGDLCFLAASVQAEII